MTYRYTPRYDLLDGLRGLAALAVVLTHMQLLEVGHYAVMVFFVISGYCITASTMACYQKGFGFQTFIKRRLHRIYPPYFLALCFYLLTRVLKITLGGHNDLSSSWVNWLQNFTLTQWVSLLWQPTTLASENPTLWEASFWSLNYEEQFYLCMGLGLFFLKYYQWPLMRWILLLCIPALCLNFYQPAFWLCGFFIEYWVHFALGALLYLVLCHHPRGRWIFSGALCLLAMISFIQISEGRAFSELGLLSVVTLCLLWVRPWSERISQQCWWKPFWALGLISYSLYLVHQFNLVLVDKIAVYMLPQRVPSFFNDIIRVFLHIFIALCFWYVAERPFLNKKII